MPVNGALALDFDALRRGRVQGSAANGIKRDRNFFWLLGSPDISVGRLSRVMTNGLPGGQHCTNAIVAK